MSAKELHEIAAERFEPNRYDGLYSPRECACMKNESMPCRELYADSTAGYKTQADPATGYNFMVGPERDS